MGVHATCRSIKSEDSVRGTAEPVEGKDSKWAFADRLMAVLGPAETHRILIVDDDRFAREYLRKVLASKFWSVSVLDCAARILDVVRESRPDVILLDCELAGVNGLDVCRRIRAAEDGRGIPVIILSGNRASDMRGPSLDAGAADFWEKATCPLELRRRLTELFSRKASD